MTLCSASLVGQAISTGRAHANRRSGALKISVEGAIRLLAGAHNGALALKTAANRQGHEGGAGASVADGNGAGGATIVVVGALGNGAVLNQGEVDGRPDDLLEESE